MGVYGIIFQYENQVVINLCLVGLDLILKRKKAGIKLKCYLGLKP